MSSVLALNALRGLGLASYQSVVAYAGVGMLQRSLVNTWAAQHTLTRAWCPGPVFMQSVGWISTSGHTAVQQAFADNQGQERQDVPQPHPSARGGKQDASYLLMHPVYSKDYTESVKPTHLPTEKLYQRVAFFAIQTVRKLFDITTGYGPDMTEAKWLRRIIFLETVAGVPGMVGGMLRHMRSLRGLRRDHGWIHTLLEEAENERMHLLTFMQLREAGRMFRGMVLLSQGVFFNMYLLAYLVSPKTCHSLVGYLEEEAVKTYTHCLEDIDSGKLALWATKPAPDIAKFYWKLPDDAVMRDVILAVRADEACHSHVNHTFSKMKATDPNPFSPGSHLVP